MHFPTTIGRPTGRAPLPGGVRGDALGGRLDYPRWLLIPVRQRRGRGSAHADVTPGYAR